MRLPALGSLGALALALFASACAPSASPAREEPLAKVASRTIDDAHADAVFGQPDLASGGAPTVVSQSTLNAPGGLATDPFFGTRGSDALWVADTGSNRVRAFHQADFAFDDLRGQPTYAGGDANAGNVDPVQNGFDHPLAVAWASDTYEWMAADTANQRVVRGYMNSPPRLVYGQHGSFLSKTPNESGISSTSLSSPKGVALAEGYAYVADAGNHRVLGFPSGSTYAAYLFGQSDYSLGDPNGGVTGVSAISLLDPHGLAVATSTAPPRWRGLWIADTGNHRVLHVPYLSTAADLVIGQAGYNANVLVSPPTAQSLNAPTAVALDPQGGVWVADTGNHRVVHFARAATVADRVLGQPDFVHGDPPAAPSATRLLAPTGVAVGGNGDLFVADTGDHRVLRFRFTCVGAADCDDGDPCTDDACTATGCTHAFQTYSSACAPYACVFATRACATSCSPGSVGQCGAGFFCLVDRCVRQCGTDADCGIAAGHPLCRQGYCCDRDCGGLCESCSEGGSEGVCTTVYGAPRRGTCPGLDGDCAGRCDGAHPDACTPTAVGTACGSEGCVAGVAHDRGACDGAGSCRATTHGCGAYGCLPAGCVTSCERDADCAAGAYCDGGACLYGPLASSGGGCAIASRGAEPGDVGFRGLLGLVALCLLAPPLARGARRLGRGGRRA